MSDAPDIADENQAPLAELRELALAGAREAQARLMAAEDSKGFAELSLAFGRLARSVRQTVALQAKLQRERERVGREAAAEARRVHDARISRRKAQVQAAVERAIWSEAEDDEAERLLADLDDRLEEEALYDDFGRDPVAAHIVRIANDLGLPDPPFPGEVSAKPAEAEGASAAASPLHGLSGPPDPLRDPSPYGEASERRSSA